MPPFQIAVGIYSNLGMVRNLRTMNNYHFIIPCANSDKWYVNQAELGLKLAFMSNEEYIVLALPDNKNNILDIQNILICQSPEAVRWGWELFSYFKDISNKIN